MAESRSKRANAGNKLQKLIEQEKLLTESTKSLQTSFGAEIDGEDNDDLVNLLFQGQEDTEDQDFSINVKENEDDYFTDDDEGSGSSDEEAGEKALQEEEKKRKKRKTQQQVAAGTLTSGSKNAVPILRKRKATTLTASLELNQEGLNKRKKFSEELLNPENLLSEERRTSSRKSVVANKLKVYKNLQEAEKARKELHERLKHLNERKHVYVLTQEDRLREAKETEKLNLQSLNRFKELEDFNKQKRLLLQQRNKIKFQEDELVLTQLSCDWRMTPLMEVKDHEYWAEQIRKRESKNKRRKPTKKSTTPTLTLANAESLQVAKPLPTVDDLIKYDLTPNLLDEKSKESHNVSSDAPLEQNILDLAQQKIHTNTGAEAFNVEPSTHGSAEKKQLPQFDKDGNILIEGPEQRVSKNFVTLFKYDDFDSQAITKPVFMETMLGISPHLLQTKGKQSAQLASTFYDPENWETILHSKRKGDAEPMHIFKVDLLDNQEALCDRTMASFPRFGEFNKKFQVLETNETNVTEMIKLQTPAPTGLYLPNGQRKPCLIKGTSSQYFDPKFGIPYGDLDSYRLLQEMVQHPDLFKWYGLKNGGLLYNPNVKPASGVPEGF
ncbi:Vacuolar protein sorting-associated protein 72 [Hanseniaspora osmophila]|uniref:Vacuolar protein sorting-associated protein 72 n=1 Tax=Hanseniaspora osmophila TaxID=56408 RepID=A0A1E5R0V4_9ASCO|nr:Vacuolar protein sorting-associated protein 72 [Hanseniaspora osmophila]